MKCTSVYLLHRPYLKISSKKNLMEADKSKRFAPIVLSGCSGVGKGTLINNLLQNYPDIFQLSVSLTTRGPRPGQVEGREYFFVTQQFFQREIDKDSFAQHCEVHGNRYGTHKQKLNQIIDKKKIALLDIDIQGGQKIKKNFEVECNYLWIDAASLAVIEDRLRKRKTETEEAIQRRLKNAQGELQTVAKLEYYDHLLNQDLKEAQQTLKKYVEKKYEIKL